MIQTQMFVETAYEDFSDKRVLVSLSAGINSAAVLCYLASEYPQEYKPKELFIFYAHLKEHSPDSFQFVKDCIRYAQKHWQVTWGIHRGSVIRFFRQERMIPHPILSPCSEQLKWIPAKEFATRHRVDVDLVGYIRTEQSRITRQKKNGAERKKYPISHLSEDDCFSIVDREIGWHPAIYDIRLGGKRVFRHNNCLPCKNWQGKLSKDETTEDFEIAERYYPDYIQKARELAIRLNAYWGRDKEFTGYCPLCELLA